MPSEDATAEADGESARSDRPRRTRRYVDRLSRRSPAEAEGSEDASRQMPGGHVRNKQDNLHQPAKAAMDLAGELRNMEPTGKK